MYYSTDSFYFCIILALFYEEDPYLLDYYIFIISAIFLAD